MNNNEIFKKLQGIINDLEKISNETDNENPNVRFIQEIDAAIDCLKTAVKELEPSN